MDRGNSRGTSQKAENIRSACNSGVRGAVIIRMKNLFGRKSFYWMVVTCIGLSSLAEAAKVELASLFQNHMVLQQGVAVPVWGWGTAGQQVTVSYDQQQVTGTVAENGKWMVKLAPLSARKTGTELTVKVGTSSQVLSDVVVGEVWICSGQSNMFMPVTACPEVKSLVQETQNVRSFKVHNIVAFDEQEKCQGTWALNVPDSAVGASFAHYLQSAEDVPVGIIFAAWGSSGLEAWMPKELGASVPHFQILLDRFAKDQKTRDRIQGIISKGGKVSSERPDGWSGGDDIFLRRQTNILYNAMMHPLIPYACRGVVWYQGERNTQSMYGMPGEAWYKDNSGMLKYGDMLKKWAQCLRQRWGNPELHFNIVMLPQFSQNQNTSLVRDTNHPEAHHWGWMRESQMQILELPHTSVANTIDLGNPRDIHPKDKGPIGERLALLARLHVLGRSLVGQGPRYQGYEVKGNKVVIRFDQELVTTDGAAPSAFWISDDQNNWAQAQASVDGMTISVWSEKVSKPTRVRYAFAGAPSVNLVNKEGLPAYPFRTDQAAPLRKGK